jgi:hypothetical protein
MKKLFLAANIFSLLAINSHAQIKVAPIQNNRMENQNVQTVNIPKKQVAFRLAPFSAVSLPANAMTALNLTVKEFDLGNNTRGNSFVAPENGIYHFDVRLNFSPILTDNANYLRFHLILQKSNGTEIERTSLMNPGTQYTPFYTLSISTTIALNAGEAISASYLGDANPGTPAVNVTAVSFSGFKVNDLEPGNAASGIR